MKQSVLATCWDGGNRCYIAATIGQSLDASYRCVPHFYNSSVRNDWRWLDDSLWRGKKCCLTTAQNPVDSYSFQMLDSSGEWHESAKSNTEHPRAKLGRLWQNYGNLAQKKNTGSDFCKIFFSFCTVSIMSSYREYVEIQNYIQLGNVCQDIYWSEQWA